jgi:hypothetical protein
MTISYETQWDAGDNVHGVPMRPVVSPVPVAVDAKWTLVNFTVAATFLDASGVAAASSAARYIPGVLEGHMYKLTIVVDSTDEDLVVTMGGVAVGTIAGAAPGTYVYNVRPTDGDPLKIATTAVSTTAVVSSIVVECIDPLNIDLLPAEVSPVQL